MLQNRAEAQDVTQWTFVRAVEVQIETEDRGRALGWLYTTCTNRCLTLLRDERTRRRIRDTYPEEVMPGAFPGAEATAMSRDLLSQTLAAVSERTAQIALLTWGQGMSNNRAAELLKTSTRTIVRARKEFEAAALSVRDEEVL